MIIEEFCEILTPARMNNLDLLMEGCCRAWNFNYSSNDSWSTPWSLYNHLKIPFELLPKFSSKSSKIPLKGFLGTWSTSEGASWSAPWSVPQSASWSGSWSTHYCALKVLLWGLLKVHLEILLEVPLKCFFKSSSICSSYQFLKCFSNCSLKFSFISSGKCSLEVILEVLFEVLLKCSF